MELSFIILILIVVALIFLIFKFIKKVVFAVLSVVFLIVLIFGGVLGLAYFDVKSLSDQTDYVVDLALLDEKQDYVLGLEIPFVEGSLNLEGVSSVSNSDFSDFGELNKISKDDSRFVITMGKDLYESLLVKDSYSLEKFASGEEFADYDLTLSRDEIIGLIDSSDSISELVDLLFSKNSIDGVLAEFAKPSLVTMLEGALDEQGVSLNEALFVMSLEANLGNDAIMSLIEGYKDDEVMVYPDRFTFKLIRMLPAGLIQSQLDKLNI